MPFLKQSVKYETASWVERFFRKPAHCKRDSRLDLPIKMLEELYLQGSFKDL